MPDLSPVNGRERPGRMPGRAGLAPAASDSVVPRTEGREGRNAVVYLDHLAATPCDPEAAELMRRLAVEEYANPSSSHAAGRRASEWVERARRQLADAIDALPEEIVFTSGATESNNLAILGVAGAARERNDQRRKLLTLAIEHPSVLAPFSELGRRGWQVEFVPVDRDGRVDVPALEEALDGALLLSIQAANNEIGTMQPLGEVSRLAAERGVLVHSDAAQILGKAAFSVEALALDLVSLSAHKCHGPKGAGALWMRGGAARTPLCPIAFGGGHEQGLRPGTPNAPAIAGFGLAAEIAMSRMESDAVRIGALRDRFERGLKERLGNHVRVNGAFRHRLPHATSVSFFDADGRSLDADAIGANLLDVDLSTASACRSGTPEPSHVLRAVGLSPAEAYGTLRLGLGRGSTDSDVDTALERILSAVQGQLRLGADGVLEMPPTPAGRWVKATDR